MSQEIPTISRPIPKLNADTEEWWAGLRRHELLVQECASCGHLLHPPGPMCPECRSLDRGWRKCSGKGKVYSWVIINRPMHPYFFGKAPFPVVLVEMEEGFRVVGSIDCEIDQLCDGLPVEADFQDESDEFSMLLFRVVL